MDLHAANHAGPARDAIRVRPARSADAATMASLLVELGYEATPEVIASRFAGLEGHGEVALVATRGDGPPLGLVTVHVTRVLHRPAPVGRLTALVVTAGARGRGVGRALVDAAEAILAARGCGLVEVTSNIRLTGAHAFYRRLGYEATSYRFGKQLRQGPARSDR